MRVRLLSLACGVSVALALVAGGGVSAAPSPALPALSIDQPQDHGTSNNPILLIFETTADLTKMTAGSADSTADPTQPAVYLHLGVDSAYYMPTYDQLEQVGQHQYQYELPRQGPGFHTFKVYWADSKTHKPVGPVVSVFCKVSNN